MLRILMFSILTIFALSGCQSTKPISSDSKSRHPAQSAEGLVPDPVTADPEASIYHYDFIFPVAHLAKYGRENESISADEARATAVQAMKLTCDRIIRTEPNGASFLPLLNKIFDENFLREKAGVRQLVTCDQFTKLYANGPQFGLSSKLKFPIAREELMKHIRNVYYSTHDLDPFALPLTYKNDGRAYLGEKPSFKSLLKDVAAGPAERRQIALVAVHHRITATYLPIYHLLLGSSATVTDDRDR